MGHIPEDQSIFKEYASNKHNFDLVRICAYELLVDFLSVRADEDLLEYLYDAIEHEHSLGAKHHIVMHLCRNAPFKFNFDEISRAEFFVNRHWSLMLKFAFNYRLKSGLAKLYQLLYGFNKPKCLKQVMKPFNEAVEAIVF